MAEGTLRGLVEGGKEFIPSTLSSLRGIGQGLWALAKDPGKVSAELADACIACVDFIQTHSTRENLQLIVPELKELVEKWHTLTDREKGQRTGFIIGKYGVDIFACGTLVKGVKYYRDLRRVNALCTLEACSISRTQCQLIETAATQHLCRRAEYFAKVKIHSDKQGKHIVGHRNFIEDRRKSIFEHPRPDDLLKKHAGTGVPTGGEIAGPAGYRELVDFGEHIGFYVDRDTAAVPAEKIPSEKFRSGDIFLSHDAGNPRGVVEAMRRKKIPRYGFSRGKFSSGNCWRYWAKIATTRGVIHYDKNGAAHIVPTLPNAKRGDFMVSESPRERGMMLLSAHSALVGAVLPNLRCVYIDWDDVLIRMYFVFDGEYSEDDQEEMECVLTEVVSDFPDRKVQSKFMSVPTSKPRPSLGRVCVFARKEP